VDLGFPVRIFRLTTTYNISIRLNNPQADQIYIDYQTTPFHLNDIPAGLSFNKFFVTNPYPSPITIGLFAMG